MTMAAKKNEPQRRSLPETVTLTLSVAIVLGLMGYLAWHGLTIQNRRPPMVVARVLRDRAVKQVGRDRWTVPVEVRSACDTPLQEIQVTVEAVGRDGKTDETEITVGYLPERGSETTLVVLEQEPSNSNPQATIRSFRLPGGAKGY